nr:integrase, catalytic region, zinc finger, CCHC-type, peptidase aspartic, catalytic [Tanacetum cinerariifolium]
MGKVFTNVGYRWIPTGRTFTMDGIKYPLTRIASTTVVRPKKPLLPTVIKKTPPSSNTLGKLKDVTNTLKTYYEDVRITHQTSVARTLQQNDVVEIQNWTLVEAARTMCIFSKAPLYLLNEWDILFQPIFDEYFNLPTSVVSRGLPVVAPQVNDTAGTPLSTSIKQDAPAASTSSTTQETRSLFIHEGVEE